MSASAMCDFSTTILPKLRVALTQARGGIGKQWNVVGQAATRGVISALAVPKSASHEGALARATGKREHGNPKTNLVRGGEESEVQKQS